jgi:Clp amino terminal domain, pathogenicity island component
MPAASRLVAMYDRFSETARSVVARAEVEAFTRGCAVVEPSDVLIALSGYSGVAGSVLRAVAADVELLRSVIAPAAPAAEGAPMRSRPLPLSARSADAFSIASREADGLGAGYVGTEHLLLGLLREPSGRVTDLLLEIRRDPGLVRERILDLVSSHGFVSPEAPVFARVPVVGPPVAPPGIVGEDRELLEAVLDEVAQLRAEIALLRAELAGIDERADRNIA